MFQDIFSNPLGFVLSFLALVVAISVHEFSHAFVADRLGDPTPSLQGRLTLNPLAHLDPIGTILLLFFRFGWGKPVQFDPFNLHNPRRDAALISVAGPISNFLMAIVGSLLLRGVLLLPIAPPVVNIVLNFLVSFVSVNIVLGIFNLVPIHPLDGFKIVGGFLSEHQAKQWYELERYGYIFLIALLLTPAMTNLISPPINFLMKLLLPQI